MVAGKDADPHYGASLELDLPRDASAPSVARAAIRGLSEGVQMTGARYQTLLLLVSEIVTNAVLHSKAPQGKPIQFTANANTERIRIDVHDGGPEFNPPAAAARRQTGSWGLHLLEREAQSWGVQQDTGTLVWFELALDGCIPDETTQP
jgi:anti-sigma regulatory factor (Ser/Thr protein kinase)